MAAAHNTLIVYVGGLGERLDRVAPLMAKLRGELGLSKDDTWVYPRRMMWRTRGPLEKYASDLCKALENYWVMRGRPEKVILIGHSIGGVLVRYAYLLGLGALGGARRDWAGSVSRIVLLAAPNRGVNVGRLGPAGRWLSWLWNPIAAAIDVVADLAAMDLRLGTVVMTNLRLEWIRRFAAKDDGPVVVQVLGSNEELVTNEDSRDVVGRPNGAKLALPGANHSNIMRPDGPGESFAGEKWQVLHRAILDPDMSPNDDDLPPMTEQEQMYASVVFVLHGIRAGSDTWVDDLADELRKDSTVLVVPPSYGRMSALMFALPAARRHRLGWFADQYTYHLARHPMLDFHFVGHSNGTYLLGQSLRRFAAMRVERVFLGGSVLPRGFAWRKYHDRGQVGRLVNVCADADKPVGWLCRALNGFFMRDIGTGGVDGFNDLPESWTQTRYLAGDHSVAFESSRVPAIAQFIQKDKWVDPVDLTGGPSGMFAFVFRFAPALAWLILGGLVAATALAIGASSIVPLAVLLGTLILIFVVLAFV